MLTTTLAAIGAVAGLGGLALSAYAILHSRTMAGDFRALTPRLVPETGGVDPHAIRDVAVVRYDALEEMSGARSFSLAMLTATGDGVVVTSINGRTESRTYAKTIEGGRAVESLSPEEYRALRTARLGQGAGRTVASGEDAGTHAAHDPNEGGSGAGAAEPAHHAPESAPSVRRVGRGPRGETAMGDVPKTST